MSEFSGIIFDESFHYLDHLAPFCALRGLPLIICEEAIAEPAREFYPDLEVLEMTWPNVKLPPSVITCATKPLLLATFPFAKLRSAWLPHGNSDKGWKAPFFEALKTEEKAFVYGQKMIDFMAGKQVLLPRLQIEKVGNFRLEYFQKHAPFYRELLRRKIDRPASKRTLLYAPTWKDPEDNSSFWQAFPILAKTLPDSYTLLVKLHPNTHREFAPQIERLIGQTTHRPNIIWLPPFPPIYPLLEIADAYIGDMSSIGYDYLHFNRPMYFLNSNRRDSKKDPGLYLYRCGQELLPEDYSKLFEIDQDTHMADSTRFGKIRQEVYQYTFTPPDQTSEEGG